MCLFISDNKKKQTMKTKHLLITLLFAILFIYTGYCQEVNWYFAPNLDAPNDLNISGAKFLDSTQDDIGNTYILVEDKSNLNSDRKFAIIKLSPNGTLQWQNKYDFPCSPTSDYGEEYYSIQMDTRYQLAVVGQCNDKASMSYFQLDGSPGNPGPNSVLKADIQSTEKSRIVELKKRASYLNMPLGPSFIAGGFTGEISFEKHSGPRLTFSSSDNHVDAFIVKTNYQGKALEGIHLSSDRQIEINDFVVGPDGSMFVAVTTLSSVSLDDVVLFNSALGFHKLVLKFDRFFNYQYTKVVYTTLGNYDDPGFKRWYEDVSSGSEQTRSIRNYLRIELDNSFSEIIYVSNKHFYSGQRISEIGKFQDNQASSITKETINLSGADNEYQMSSKDLVVTQCNDIFIISDEVVPYPSQSELYSRRTFLSQYDISTLTNIATYKSEVNNQTAISSNKLDLKHGTSFNINYYYATDVFNFSELNSSLNFYSSPSGFTTLNGVLLNVDSCPAIESDLIDAPNSIIYSMLPYEFEISVSNENYTILFLDNNGYEISSEIEYSILNDVLTINNFDPCLTEFTIHIESEINCCESLFERNTIEVNRNVNIEISQFNIQTVGSNISFQGVASVPTDDQIYYEWELYETNFIDDATGCDILPSPLILHSQDHLPSTNNQISYSSPPLNLPSDKFYMLKLTGFYLNEDNNRCYETTTNACGFGVIEGGRRSKKLKLKRIKVRDATDKK